MKYFYSRAQENDREKVSEKDFQYQGPKPQTKEAAVLMLADSVEAAVRSLREPSPGRIEGVVRKIIKERLASGLLDESELTFRDLDKIGTSFVRTLSGIYHQRVEYPQLKSWGKGLGEFSMGEVAVLCGEELNEEEVEGYLAFLKQVTAVALRRLIEREDWELTVSLVGEGADAAA